LTGENDFERERADDPTPPDDMAQESSMDSGDLGVHEVADEPRRSRKFAATWGAAQSVDSGPSFWRRTSERIKQLFARKKSDEQDAIPHTSEQPVADDFSIPVVDESASEPVAAENYDAPAAAEPEVVESFVAEPFVPEAPLPEPEPYEPVANEPKEDLKFLWTGSEEPSVEPPAEEPVSEGPTAEMGELPEPVIEKPKKRPSFLKRIFGRAPKMEEAIPDTDETSTSPVEEPVEEPAAVEAEATTESWEPEAASVEAAALDEALPMDEPRDEQPADAALDSVDEALLAHDAPIEEALPTPKKLGFFGRLFGKKPVAPEPVEELPDAVESLDAVDEGFAAARDEFAPPEHAGDRSFASVDDALPLEMSTMDERPAVDHSSFMPPEPVAEVPAAPVAEPQFFGENTYDFDTPKADDRSTMEVAAVDDRKTAPVDLNEIAHAEEAERKTDEFEMVEMDMSTLQEPAVSPLEGKTAEVPKVSFIKKIFGRTKEVTQVEPAVAPPPSANPTFLVQKFRTFYNEVVVYKNQKAEFTAGFATAIVTDYTADLSPEQAASSLMVRLQQMLELQLAESSWMGGEIAELYPDAQYAMAVLADEMLTHMEWPGQAAWGRHRLELTVFKTAASDLELFKRVDKLLKNGPQTVGTRDLARVYLLAIASGFKGKYRPFDLPRALAEYRRRLYEFVYGGDALLLYADERRIFPEAIAHIVVGRGVKRFSLAQQWAAILVLLLVGYTVVSHMAWKKVSADLKDIAGRVEQARSPVPPETPNGAGGR
jgi:type VI secretion system protein ImpK